MGAEGVEQAQVETSKAEAPSSVDENGAEADVSEAPASMAPESAEHGDVAQENAAPAQDLEALYAQGVDAMINWELDEAESQFAAIVAAAPGSPLALEAEKRLEEVKDWRGEVQERDATMAEKFNSRAYTRSRKRSMLRGGLLGIPVGMIAGTISAIIKMDSAIVAFSGPGGIVVLAGITAFNLATGVAKGMVAGAGVGAAAGALEHRSKQLEVAEYRIEVAEGSEEVIAP